MLRLPFRWEIPQSKNSYSETGHSCPELHLNDDWKLVFICDMFANQSIKVCRQTAYEEMLVSGTLSCKSNGQVVSTQEFSKIIKPGASFIIINMRQSPGCMPTFAYGQRSHEGPRTLDGIVCITSSSEKCSSDYQLKSLVQLSNDLELLLDPQASTYADVNLKCGDVLLPAHKIILSTRSPIFADKLKENHENTVDITDLEASVLKAMLIYIYSGKTYNLTVSSASHLLFAAKQYQLEDLKRVCCDFLKENISLQNVLRVIDLGDKHSEDLKYSAVDYFCEKCSDFSVVEKTEEWKTFRNETKDLALDVLISLVKSRDRKLNGVNAS